MSQESEVLRSEFDLEFTYTRTYGPVLGEFFTELKAGNVVGIKGSDGKVICPPLEYDPVTAESLSEFVPLATTGVVTNWCWVKEPRSKHPLQKPFAWAQIQIDGADTTMLHALDVSDESAITKGMKVKIRWVDEPVGRITDIACFEPA